MDGALLRASLSSVAIQRELRPKALPRRPRLLASFAFATPGDAVQGSYSLACQRVSNAGTSWRRATFARVCNLLQTSPADLAEENVREMEMDMSCMYAQSRGEASEGKTQTGRTPVQSTARQTDSRPQSLSQTFPRLAVTRCGLAVNPIVKIYAYVLRMGYQMGRLPPLLQ